MSQQSATPVRARQVTFAWCSGGGLRLLVLSLFDDDAAGLRGTDMREQLDGLLADRRRGAAA